MGETLPRTSAQPFCLYPGGLCQALEAEPLIILIAR